MQHYRCRCGKAEGWGSMPPPQCDGCPDCGTTLELRPENYTEPKPHEYYLQETETDFGLGVISRCRFCNRTKREIERG